MPIGLILFPAVVLTTLLFVLIYERRWNKKIEEKFRRGEEFTDAELKTISGNRRLTRKYLIYKDRKRD